MPYVTPAQARARNRAAVLLLIAVGILLIVGGVAVHRHNEAKFRHALSGPCEPAGSAYAKALGEPPPKCESFAEALASASASATSSSTPTAVPAPTSSPAVSVPPDAVLVTGPAATEYVGMCKGFIAYSYRKVDAPRNKQLEHELLVGAKSAADQDLRLRPYYIEIKNWIADGAPAGMDPVTVPAQDECSTLGG